MLIWIAFLVFILALLALDLGVFHRESRVVRPREAMAWTCVWMVVALAFAGFVYLGYANHWLGMGLDPDAAERSAAFPEGRVNDARAATLKYLTGYVVELSLSVDNVFVIAMLFTYFGVPPQFQHRVLFWGILGALAMRGVMIALGATLVAQFSWLLYVFGGLLIVTAVRMVSIADGHQNPEQTLVVRAIRRFLPVTQEFHGEHFFVRASTPAANGGARRGGLVLTPLALVLAMVESTDLLFAIDSIPAILSITADPFLVFTSNVFAILGLRSLYFALAGALDAFRYLKYALAAVLLTIGVKMLAHTWLERVLGDRLTLYVLAAVVAILGAGVAASMAHRWLGRTRSQATTESATLSVTARFQDE